MKNNIQAQHFIIQKKNRSQDIVQNMSNRITMTTFVDQIQDINQFKPMLYYLPIRGIAQPIRNILHYLEVEYDQMNFNSEQDFYKTVRKEASFTQSFGLPKLTHQGKTISQVVSICRYLLMRYNREDLLGRTPQIQAQVNQILFKYTNQKSKMVRTIFKGIQEIAKQPKKKLQIQWRLFKQIIQESTYIQGCLKLYLKSKGFVFNQLTIIDFFFYEACFYIANFFGNIISYHPIYNNIKAYKDFFENLPFYKQNQEKIEQQRIFLRISGEKNQRILTSIWDDHTSNLF